MSGTARPRSKTHHYLPQFILSGFARDGRIATRDLVTGASYVQAIAKAAAENDYNTVELDGDVKSDIAEAAIATDIEGPASTILHRIATGGWLETADERRAVALFLTLQYLRVPAHREMKNALA